MSITERVRFITLALALGALWAGLPGLPALPSAAAATTVQVSGHGYGHGRGMGQYGALGYALDAGWGAQQITDHFYGGTRLGYQPNRSYSIRLTGLDGANEVRFSSTSAISVGSLFVGANVGVIMRRAGNGWSLLTQFNGCAGDGRLYGPWSFANGTVIAPAGPQGPNLADLLTVCNTGVGYRGSVALPLENGSTRVVNITTMEEYLRGVVPRESPAGWADLGGGQGRQALYAQAIAARSYAYAERRYPYADTCDTTSCQVYSGAAVSGRSREDPRTNDAVATTGGLVRVHANGAIARTEFSSSTGGYTAGGTFPAVPDAGDSRSPYQNWTAELSTAELSARYGIGSFQSIRVLGRNGLGAEGGRVSSVQIVGSAGAVTRTGDQFRLDWGLRSNWFTPQYATTTTWLFRNAPTAGRVDAGFPFGGAADTTLSCDFDGNGGSEIVVFRNGFWSVRGTVNPGAPTSTFAFGSPGMRPVCGDWDRNGTDGIGVFDATGTFHLRNTASGGPADARFAFGWAAALPVAGNFGGPGGEGIGIYDPATATWYLRTSPTPGPAELSFAYGWGGSVPLVGDWDGNGVDGIGAYADGIWVLRNAASAGPADNSFAYGAAGFAPVVGNWDGVGGDGIGVTVPT